MSDKRWILYRPDIDRYLGGDETWIEDWKVAKLLHWSELSLILQKKGVENRAAIKPLSEEFSPHERTERVETYLVRRVEVCISVDKLIMDE